MKVPLSEVALEERRIYSREYRKKNRERVLEYHRNYERSHPEKLVQYKMNYWEKRGLIRSEKQKSMEQDKQVNH